MSTAAPTMIADLKSSRITMLALAVLPTGFAELNTRVCRGEHPCAAGQRQ
jgi:hypothetical protein